MPLPAMQNEPEKSAEELLSRYQVTPAQVADRLSSLAAKANRLQTIELFGVTNVPLI